MSVGASEPCSEKNAWVKFPRPNPRAEIRLFSFPYSGAGCSVFYRWSRELPENVELCPVQLPGRENRLSEPPMTDMQRLVEAAAAGLLPYLNKPFAFFGHSMGALLSFELARYLESRLHVTPTHLFVSGHNAPQIPCTRAPIHALPEEQFLVEVCKLNGMASEVIESEELMRLILPILRADFMLCETYRYQASEPWPCPISALGGSWDRFVTPQGLEAWEEHTKGPFSVHLFPGDHFYIHTNRMALLETICQKISEHH